MDFLCNFLVGGGFDYFTFFYLSFPSINRLIEDPKIGWPGSDSGLVTLILV